MEELRVPTADLAAEVILADGRVLRGKIFLPAISDLHSGPPQPGEWINSPSRFFPFRPDGQNSAVLLNKAQVIALSVPLTAADQEDSSFVDQPVVVESLHHEVRGRVVIDMPPSQSRLLDLMNCPENFLALWQDGTCELIHKKFITRIHESES